MDTSDIRRATLDDIPGMIDCVNQAYEHYIERLGKPPGPMLDDYENRIKNDEAYVIRSDDIVVGVLVLIIDEERCLLDNVAVSNQAQGQGLGKKLVAFAEARAAQLGFDAIELYTHELMTENVEIYEKWGYSIVRRITEKGFDRIYMRKFLI